MAGRVLPGLVAAGVFLSVLTPGLETRADEGPWAVVGADEGPWEGLQAVVPAEIRLVEPESRSWVARTVPLRARVDGPAAAVLFEVSLDDGGTWAVVGIDRDPKDGWRSEWRTLGYNGDARLRATKVGVPPAKHSIAVRVDNVPPEAGLRLRRTLISPNRDGRRDGTTFRLRSNEPTTARFALTRKGDVYRRWYVRLRKNRARRIEWAGGVKRGRLSDGRYRIAGQVRDRAGWRSEMTGHVVVDVTPPRLRWRGTRSGPGSKHRRTTVRYWAGDRHLPLRVAARVVGGGGVVASQKQTSRGGKASIAVRTRYADGDELYPGAYRTVLSATDAAGNPRSRERRWYVHRSMKGRVYHRLEGAGRRVALTFDDCHYEGAWARILDVLKRRAVKATFFCPGPQVRMFPALAERTVRAGHAVGSHGWDHFDLSGMAFGNVYWRLMADRRAWMRAGTTSAPYFRPPYGAWSTSTVAAAGATSHPRVVMWDVDSGDTAGASGSTLICNVVCDARSGSIILLHTKEVTADALDQIITGLRQRRLRPVSLPTLFRAAGHR